MRVRVITKFDHRAFLINCQSWLKSNKHSLMKCPVQTEESADIGWLGYSSIYSDKEFIAKTLSRAVGYEVGVRLGAIANKAESKVEWRKKTRGLIVVVPLENEHDTRNKMTELFRKKKENNHNNQNNEGVEIFHILSFLPLETDIARMPNCAKNFGICLQRHQVHHKSIRGQFEKIFIDGISRKINTLKGRLNLREMILKIKSTDPKMKGARLFQSIDYIENASKVYFQHDKKNGPECDGFIFQFYQSMENEAAAMIKGLGVYLNQVYGEEATANKLAVHHWTADKSWAWDDENKVFVTPDERMVAELIQLDTNAGIIGIESELLEVEEKDYQLSNVRIEQQEEQLIQLLANQDLDPITRLDQPINQPTAMVQIPPPQDQPSTTSTLTDREAMELNDTSSTITHQRNNHNAHMRRGNGNDSISSQSTTNTANMRDLLDPTLS